MKFKNELERRCCEIAVSVCGDVIQVLHNEELEIECALFPEVAAFSGPPKKEIDVLAIRLSEASDVKLLVSCKQLNRRAVPAHVQEWASVVATMNKYAEDTTHFGLIVCPSGFSRGCEPWATAHNIGLLPPMKGKSLAFRLDTVHGMFERVVRALVRRVALEFDDLVPPPRFYEFVYGLAADFEGYEEEAVAGRYFLSPTGWVSSFQEMVSAVRGLVVEDIVATDDAMILMLSDDVVCRYSGVRIDFGGDAAPTEVRSAIPTCGKNFVPAEPCSFEFVRELIRGLSITSAADFGDYIEFGLDARFNLGLHVGSLHLCSTENPYKAHLL